MNKKLHKENVSTNNCVTLYKEARIRYKRYYIQYN